MPLATKNNRLIVKGGRVAQNCACCTPLTCDSLAAQDEITLSVTCEDRTKYTEETVVVSNFPGCDLNDKRGFTGLFPGNDYAGTFVLTKVSSGKWEYYYPIAAPVCENPFSYLGPEIAPNPRLRITRSSGCNYRLLITLFSVLYCDYAEAGQHARGDFDCVARNTRNGCSGVFSAVQGALELDAALTLNLSGSGPFLLWSGDINGPGTCSGPAEMVTFTNTFTGSSAISVSLVG